VLADELLVRDKGNLPYTRPEGSWGNGGTASLILNVDSSWGVWSA
jgi:predicted glycosyl hydrolase (DUF1957 family)